MKEDRSMENQGMRQKFLYGIRGMLLVIVCICAFMFTGQVCKAAESEHSLQFFFENVCASCHEEDDFYDLFNRVISKEEKQEISYEIRTYNVFRNADMEVYEQKLAEYDLTRTDIQLPVLLVDGQWISGYDKIEEELHGVLLEGKKVSEDAESYTENDSIENSTLESGLDSTSENASGEGEKSENEIYVATQARLEAEWKDLPDNTRAVLLFSTYSCNDCESAKEYLEQLKAEADLSVFELNVSEDDNLEIFKQLLELSGRSDTEGKVPAVFTGEQMFLGKEEIKEELSAQIEDGNVSLKTLKAGIDRLSETAGTEEIQKISLPVMFGAGLLAGFNPCSISMLLMLFSILLTGHSSVLQNGGLYLVGKYVTYLGIGLAFYLAASKVDQQVLNHFSKITGIVIAILFAAAAVLNLLDFQNVRKQEYGKIRMQLPQKLRHFNHTLLRRTQHMEGVFLSLLVLGLGVAISIGEFFCTGQIYMASLLYLIRTGKEQIMQLLLTLMVYVTAMSIPAIVILLIIYRTKKIERVSEFMLEHMSAIKLLNALLFLGYAVYFVVDSIL